MFVTSSLVCFVLYFFSMHSVKNNLRTFLSILNIALPKTVSGGQSRTVKTISQCIPFSICHQPWLHYSKRCNLFLRLKPIVRSPLQVELVNCDSRSNKPFWKPYSAPFSLSCGASVLLKGSKGTGSQAVYYCWQGDVCVTNRVAYLSK